MNLIIDQGNTNMKLYLFLSNKIKHFFIFPINKNDFSFLQDFKINNIIYSTVSGTNNFFTKEFSNKHILFFSSKTPIPIKNSYKSNSIGNDRLAGAVGASVIFPKQNVLSIDIGSAITFDFIKNGEEYIGGNISPGIKLRFKSLYNYTANLPLLKTSEKNIFIADNTNDAIIAGVQNGILYEINSYIKNINDLYTNTKTIITGGDSNFFAKKIKKSIFAESNLVAIGLNNILNYNIEK